MAHQVGSLQRQFAQAPGLPFAVKIVDGTTVSMADNPANQAAFPQPKTQKRGFHCTYRGPTGTTWDHWGERRAWHQHSTVAWAPRLRPSLQFQ